MNTPPEALEQLLLDLFNLMEFRRFLCRLPNGSKLLDELPGENAAKAEIVHQAVNTLLRWGLVDIQFFLRVEAARPSRRHDIHAVASQFGILTTLEDRASGSNGKPLSPLSSSNTVHSLGTPEEAHSALSPVGVGKTSPPHQQASTPTPGPQSTRKNWRIYILTLILICLTMLVGAGLALLLLWSEQRENQNPAKSNKSNDDPPENYMGLEGLDADTLAVASDTPCASIDSDHDGYPTKSCPSDTPPLRLFNLISLDTTVDCDDGNSRVHPQHEEDCDGLDNDCDGKVDNPRQVMYLDWDNDGWGVGPLKSTNEPDLFWLNISSVLAEYPYKPFGNHACQNGIESDSTCYPFQLCVTGVCDRGSGGEVRMEFPVPDHYSRYSGDCYDYSAEVFPGAKVAVDGYDEDCNAPYAKREFIRSLCTTGAIPW